MLEVVVPPLGTKPGSTSAGGKLTVTIRDFTPDDYQAVSELQNAVYPDYPSVPQDWIEADESRAEHCKHHRWMVEAGGQVVAVGQYDQHAWTYHPQHFALMVRVHPDYQGRGIGTALYEHIMAALAPFEPLQLQAMARADHPHGLRFLEQRGFKEHVREQRSAIVPAEFDPAPFMGIEDRLAAEGLTLKSYLELANDPDRDRKAYELDMAATPDVPGLDDFTPPSFEQYKKDVLDRPLLLKDVCLFAVTSDGEYVGITSLWADRASDMLYTGFTAVRRDYRRKGIATALKVRALTWAKANGITRINTDNADTNPMLQLNYRLGFRPLPAWVTFRKKLNTQA